ncbi:MAG TPA: hypothetical protein VLB76_10565 [Thermoanaerobaculia bacterium]|jgi:hypothetical protein|nr:hypothetical protein [Thermoanaerobaculia bacterium]
MITGYNTDVRHGEVVYHVQTEDKGISNPFIESLVYVGGQVLASKRASYAELLAEGKDEKDIVVLMDHQHRTMIAAIRHGRLDAKFAALAASRQTGQHQVIGRSPTSSQPIVGRMLPPTVAMPVPPPPVPARLDAGETMARGGVSSETLARPSGPTAVSVTPATPIEPMAPMPQMPQMPPAAARPARPTGPERTLDQVILEYLTSEADQEQLVLLLEEERDLVLGARATLVLRASSSKSGQAVAGTHISVRMISTVIEPRMLASGRTDDQGVLALGFDIPQVGRGTSALIINAVSSIGRAELKVLLGSL